MSVKPVASLLYDMDLSTKKIQVFTNKTRSIYYNMTTDEMILEKILRVQQKDFQTGRICTAMSSQKMNTYFFMVLFFRYE